MNRVELLDEILKLESEVKQLLIEKEEDIMKKQGLYPTIYLTFNLFQLNRNKII